MKLCTIILWLLGGLLLWLLYRQMLRVEPNLPADDSEQRINEVLDAFGQP